MYDKILILNSWYQINVKYWQHSYNNHNLFKIWNKYHTQLIIREEKIGIIIYRWFYYIPKNLKRIIFKTAKKWDTT